ncbi:MAG: PLP-dependent aminotransferase family protein [Rhodanobacter sp.]
MFLQLDGDGAHYGQLIRAIRAAILSGRLSGGTKLPSSRTLALEMGCSRTTVFAAYEDLRAEGYITGRPGSGSYVSTVAIKTLPNPLVGKRFVAPPSRFAMRARQQKEWPVPPRHPSLRFDLRCGSSQINPVLGAIWARELTWAATHTATELGSAWGLPALREQICQHLALRRGVQVTPDRVLVISGPQQAIALSAQILLNEGDTVVLEDPHCIDARQQFEVYGANTILIATDSDGLVCRALPTAPPRLVVVGPAHQFPSGALMSLSRRIELLNYAETKSCWILEFDNDSELRCDSQPLAPLRSLDRTDMVIYTGTLSKLMFGPLQLGYMVLPEAMRDTFAIAKSLEDFSCSAIQQAALAHFMANGGFERHLRHVHRELHARHREMIEGLHRHAGQRVEIAGTRVGMHLIVWLPRYDHSQLDTLIALANERGLGLYSIAPHYQERPASPGLLLGYGALSKTQLRDAMQLFGECLDTIDATKQRRMKAAAG